MGIYEFVYGTGSLMTAPFMIILGLFLIINEIGYYGFIGIGVILLTMFINMLISQKLVKIRKKTMIYSDKRSKKDDSEYISGIRLLKYYAWENYAMK